MAGTERADRCRGPGGRQDRPAHCWILLLYLGCLLLPLTLPTLHAEEKAVSLAATPVVATPVNEAPVADRELLEELMAEGGVATQTPRPKVTDYLGDLLNGTLYRALEWLFGSGAFEQTTLKVVQWMIVILVALLAIILAWQWMRWWRRERQPRATPSVVMLDARAAAEIDWRAELEERLARGDAAAALEALWWWLATRLGLEDADASWTTRELASRAKRRDLMPLVRHWDRLVYGGGEVEVEGVQKLWQGLREALA